MGSSSKGPDPQDLAKRIEALEHERAILRTLYRYCHSMDYGQEKEWVDCFTEDGVMDIYRREGKGRRAEGHAALAAFVAGHSRAPDRWTKHLVVEPRITLDGDKATVVSYMVAIEEHEGTPVVWTFGRYLDRMVKCPDGAWRFQERRVELEAGIPARKT